MAMRRFKLEVSLNADHGDVEIIHPAYAVFEYDSFELAAEGPVVHRLVADSKHLKIYKGKGDATAAHIAAWITSEPGEVRFRTMKGTGGVLTMSACGSSDTNDLHIGGNNLKDLTLLLK